MPEGSDPSARATDWWHRGRPDGPLKDPAGHAEQVNEFRSNLGEHIGLIEIEAHMNDDGIVDHVLEALDAWIAQGIVPRGERRRPQMTFLLMGADHLIRFNTPVGMGVTIAVERAEGVWLYDTEGNRYLDGRSQVNCVTFGHSHPRLVRAISEQAERLQCLSSFYQFTHPLAATVAARLAGLLAVKLNHVVFTSGGSEANEMVFMTARLYWPKEHPTKIISRIGGYHGNTSQTISATGMSMGGQTDIQNIVLGHGRIRARYMNCSDETDEETYAEACAQDLVATIGREGPEAVAAFINEPIIGVGRYFTPPAGYWRKIREICDHYNVLL